MAHASLTHTHACLLSNLLQCRTQQQSNEGKKTHTQLIIQFLASQAMSFLVEEKIKMVESIIVLRFIGELAATILCGYHCLI